MESIDALVEAISDFRGGVVVVSHDQFFITRVCSELWVVGEGKATRFRGNFDEYKAHTLMKTKQRVAESVKSLSNINNQISCFGSEHEEQEEQEEQEEEQEEQEEQEESG